MVLSAGDVGAFRVALLGVQTPERQVQSLAIHVARWGTRAQAVFFISTDADLFRVHLPTVRAMLQKGAAALSAPSMAHTPSPAVALTTPPGRPRVVEAYRLPAQRTQTGLYGGTFVERVHYERIVLLSNGVADFVRYHAFGLGADPELLSATPQTLNGYYGTWRAQGNTVVVRRQLALPEEVMTRENGNLRRGPQLWTPAPRVDGLRLSGVYAYRSDQINAPMRFNYSVEFSPDGRFRTGGLLSFLAVTDMTGRPKPPEHIAGTYEIRDWTLWFLVNGRVIWSTEFMPLTDDVRDLATVLIECTRFAGSDLSSIADQPMAHEDPKARRSERFRTAPTKCRDWLLPIGEVSA